MDSRGETEAGRKRGLLPGRFGGLRRGSTRLPVCNGCRRGLGFRKIRIIRKSLGTVKTKAALSATVGPDRQEKQDPEFKDASALGAMHMHAPTTRAGLFRAVNKKSVNTPH